MTYAYNLLVWMLTLTVMTTLSCKWECVFSRMLVLLLLTLGLTAFQRSSNATCFPTLYSIDRNVTSLLDSAKRKTQQHLFRFFVFSVLVCFRIVWAYTQGRSDGPPPPKKKSVQVNFLWGTNDVRTAIEHEHWSFIHRKNFYTPTKVKTNFWLRPCLYRCLTE